MTELKPCPFCRGAAEIASLTETKIRCSNDQCITRCDLGGYNDFNHRAEAITAWNTRTAEEGQAELVEALENAIGLIAHKMGMDTTAMVAGQTLVAREVWSRGMAALNRARGEV